MIINRSDALINAQFEGNATNSTGGTNGTWSGTEQYADSISGKAADFDGSSRVEFGNSGLSNSSSFTVFLRMNLDTHTGGDRVFSKTASTANGFWLWVNSAASDTFRFYIRNGTDTALVFAEITLPENTAYAIRCVLDLVNDEMTVSAYENDGTFSTSSTVYTQSDYTSNADNITVGNFSGGGNGSDGLVDDFTFIEGLLSEEDFYRFYMGLGVTDL